MSNTERNRTNASWPLDATRGVIAGAVATWVMGLTTTAMLANESGADKARERAARPNGRPAVDNLVRRMERMGVPVDAVGRARATAAVRYGLGIAPGAIYGVLRPRVPWLGGARGIGYGLALWAINDEFANTALGLAGPADAYPVATHWRGLVGHLVLGLVTDSSLDLMGAGRR